MTKKDLINLISKDTGTTHVKAEIVVNTIFDSMTEALLRGDRVEVRGFGSFKVKHYKSYEGRNPRTGAPISVPTKKLPVFKVGKPLKEAVNGKT